MTITERKKLYNALKSKGVYVGKNEEEFNRLYDDEANKDFYAARLRALGISYDEPAKKAAEPAAPAAKPAAPAAKPAATGAGAEGNRTPGLPGTPGATGDASGENRTPGMPGTPAATGTGAEGNRTPGMPGTPGATGDASGENRTPGMPGTPAATGAEGNRTPGLPGTPAATGAEADDSTLTDLYAGKGSADGYRASAADSVAALTDLHGGKDSADVHLPTFEEIRSEAERGKQEQTPKYDIDGRLKAIDQRRGEIERRRGELDDKRKEMERSEGFWSRFTRYMANGVHGAGNTQTTTAEQGARMAPEGESSLLSERSTLGMEEEMLKKEEDRLKQARRLRDRGDGTWDQVAGGAEDLGRGVWDALTDKSAYTLGYSDLELATKMLGIRQKIEAGEALTEAELNLLKTAHEIGKSEDIDTGVLYGFGRITGESIPFMVEMGLSGGTAMAAKGGELAGKYAAKYAGKAATKYALRESTEKALAKGLKYLGTGAAELMVGAYIANSGGAAGTWADVLNRYNGDVVRLDDGSYAIGHYDDDGNFVAGGESLGSALYKGQMAAAIESYTELLGGHLAGALNKGAAKLANRFGLTKVGRMFERQAQMEAGALADAGWGDKLLGKVAFNGYVGESLEEEAGIVLNSLLVGDDKISDLWDGRKQLDIWGGMVFSTGVMEGTGWALNKAGGAYGYRKAKKGLEDAESVGRMRLTEERWAPLQQRLDEADNEGIVDVLEEIRTDPDMSEAEKRAALDYAGALIKFRGFNQGSVVAAADEVQRDADGNVVVSEQTKVRREMDREYMQGSDEALGANDVERRLRHAAEAMTGSGDVDGALAWQEQWLGGMSVEDRIAKMRVERATDEEVEQAMELCGAISAYKGMQDAITDEADSLDKGRRELASMAAHMDGGLRQLTLKDGTKVYLVAGDVAVRDDGSVDSGASSDVISVYDPQSGNRWQTNSGEVHSVDSVMSADEVSADLDAKREADLKRMQDAAAGVLDLQPGLTVDLGVDAEGNSRVVSVVGVNGDAVSVADAEGAVSIMQRQDLQAAADAAAEAAYAERLREGASGEGASGENRTPGTPGKPDASADASAGASGENRTPGTPGKPDASADASDAPGENRTPGMPGMPDASADASGENRNPGKPGKPDAPADASAAVSLQGRLRVKDELRLRLPDGRVTNAMVSEVHDDGSVEVLYQNGPRDGYMDIPADKIDEMVEEYRPFESFDRGVEAEQHGGDGGASTHSGLPQQGSAEGAEDSEAPSTAGSRNGDGSAIETNDKNEGIDGNVAGEGIEAGESVAGSGAAAAESQPEPQVPALDRVPKDVRGKPMYHLAEDAATGWDALVESKGRISEDAAERRELAREHAQIELKRAEDDLKAALNMKQGKREDIDDFQMRRAQAVKEARQRAEAWKEIGLEQSRRETQAALAEQNEQRRQASGVGEEVSRRWEQRRRVVGRKDVVRTHDGKKYRVHYELVEAGAATPSHDPMRGYASSAGFPVDRNGNNVNDRDYEHERGAQQRTEQTAANYNELAVRNAPVVSEHGVVVSGNERTMARMLAAARGTDGEYLEYLTDNLDFYGLDREAASAMEHPQLVAVLDEPIEYTTDNFRRFNMDDRKGQDRVKQSAAIGKAMSDEAYAEVLSYMRDTDAMSDFYSGRDGNLGRVLDALVRDGVITQEQRRTMAENDGTGALTGSGEDMMESALVGKAFDGDPAIIDAVNSYKNVRRAVVMSLAEIGRNRGLGSDYSLEQDLGLALKLVKEARQGGGYSHGAQVSEFANQLRLFGDEEVSDYRKGTVMMLADAINSAKPSMLRSVLEHYNAMAKDAASGQVTINPETFEAVPARSKDELLRGLLRDAGIDVERIEANRRANEQRLTTNTESNGQRTEDREQRTAASGTEGKTQTGAAAEGRAEGEGAGSPGRVEGPTDTVGYRTEGNTDSHSGPAQRNSVGRKHNITDGKASNGAGISAKDQTAKVKESTEAIADFARQLGRKVVYEGDFSGAHERGYVEDGVIHINPEMSGAEQAAFVLGHEFAHTLEGSEEYDALVDIIKGSGLMEDFLHRRTEQLRETGKWAEARDMTWDELVEYTNGLYLENEIDIDKQGAEREVVADFVSDVVLSDEKNLRQLLSHAGARSAFQRVLDKIVKVLKKIAGRYKDMDLLVEKVQMAINASEMLDQSQKEVARSIRSMRHDLSEGKMFSDLVSKGILSQREADVLKKEIEGLVDYMADPIRRSIVDMNETYGAIDRQFFPYKPNSDPLYGISMDFSTLCSKRILTQYVIESLETRLANSERLAEAVEGQEKGKVLSAEQQLAVRRLLQRYREEQSAVSEEMRHKMKAFQVACAMCYVEAARLKAPKQKVRWLGNERENIIRQFMAESSAEHRSKVAEFEKRWKVEHGYAENTTKAQMKKKDADAMWAAKRKVKLDYRLSEEEQATLRRGLALPRTAFLTAAGLAELAEKEPVIFGAYARFICRSTKSKGLERDEPYYYGDSQLDNGKNKVVTDGFITSVNAENGMRFSSWSDWRIVHLLDYITAVIEMSVRGAAMHGYTKFPNEVRALGKTGMMFNLSGVLQGKGLKEDGSLDFSPTESIDYAEAMKVRDDFPETAGMQAIAISDETILAMLESGEIDYVIPYHKSGMSVRLRRIADIEGWTDYELRQHATKIKDATNDSGNKNWQNEPTFSEFFVGYDTGMSGIEAMRASAQKYRQLCQERGLRPKFEAFAEHPNYWKLLIDRKMINQKTGELIQQKPVKPIFDFDRLRGIVDEEVSLSNEDIKEEALSYVLEHLQEVPEIIRDMTKPQPKRKYSIMGERGARNLDRADREAGHREAASRMVNFEVAREMEARFKEIEGSEEHQRMVESAEKVRGMKAVSLDEVPSNRDKKACETIVENLEDGENKHDGRKVRFVKKSVGKLLGHKGFDYSILIPKLKELYDGSFPAFFEKEEVKPGHKDHTSNFVGYHHYVNKVSLGGKEYYVRFTIQELKTKKKDFVPNEMHNAHATEISDIEIFNTDGSVTSGIIDPTTGANIGAKPDAKLRNFFILASGDAKSFAQRLKYATGWERGADGMWRYEVPDLITPYTDLVAAIEEGQPLTEVVTDELAEAYPQLRDWRLKYDESLSGENGDTITMATTVPSEKMIRFSRAGLLDASYLDNVKARINSLKKEYRKAYGEGDVDMMDALEDSVQKHQQWFGPWELAAQIIQIVDGDLKFKNDAEIISYMKEHFKEEDADGNRMWKTFTNRHSGNTLTIGIKGITKSLNEKAKNQSVSEDAQRTALSKVDEIIANSVLGETHEDRNGDPNIVEMQRYYGAINIDGITYRVKTTAKKVKVKKGVLQNSYYTLEVQEMELIETSCSAGNEWLRCSKRPR